MNKKRFAGKHVLLGITGSIAAYKACLVLRQLQNEGAEVRVVMTQAAQKFIGPLTFEALTSNEVVTELFPAHRISEPKHIHLAEWADCILICPASANIIGKMAAGIADDFLSTLVLAAQCPILIAPAMHSQMIHNPIVKENCRRLHEFGVQILPTEEGELASGSLGLGRLAESKYIIEELKIILLGSLSLKNKRILVTAGPTREFLDPVRYISNPSSGKMGFALAEAAKLRGSQVTLIHGQTRLRPFKGVVSIEIDSVDEMAEAVEREWKKHDVLIMAAAVADYRPEKNLSQKIKKNNESYKLTLCRTTDILKNAASQKGDRMVIGFALETENDEENAIKKLKDKKLDLICLNNPKTHGAGFGGITNKVTLIDDQYNKQELPVMDKWEIAEIIMNRIEEQLTNKQT